VLALDVAAAAIEGHAGEGGSHFRAGETLGASGLLAELEDASGDAAARPRGMDEEGANFGGVGLGVEERVVAAGAAIAAVGGFAAGPAAAGCEAGGAGGLNDEIGLVVDELGVEAEPGAEGLLDLGGRVGRGAKRADGGFDERRDAGNVRGEGEAVAELGSITGFGVMRGWLF